MDALRVRGIQEVAMPMSYTETSKVNLVAAMMGYIRGGYRKANSRSRRDSPSSKAGRWG